MDPEDQDTFLDQGTGQLEQEPQHPRPYMPQPQPAGQAGLQQPPQSPMPEQVLPWSQADGLELQRHLAGLSQIEKDHAAGNLTDDEARAATGQVMPRMQALMAKQQKYQQQQMEQGVQQAMQQTALQEGIMASHKQARAQNFNAEVGTLVDPVSGHRAFFTQDQHGDWSEVKFDHAHAEQDALLGAATGKPTTLGQMGRAAQLNHSGSVDPATFEQTIKSGPYTEVYRGGKLVSSDRPPVQSPQPGQLSEQKIKAIYQMAERNVPRLRAGAGPYEILHRQNAVQETAMKMMEHERQLSVHEHDRQMQRENKEAELKLHKDLNQQELQNKLTLTREAHKQERADKKEELGPGGLTPKEHSDLLKGYIQSRRKERQQWLDAEAKSVKDQETANAKLKKDNPKAVTSLSRKVIPEWMRSDESVHNQAMADYERHVGDLEKKRTGKPAGDTVKAPPAGGQDGLAEQAGPPAPEKGKGETPVAGGKGEEGDQEVNQLPDSIRDLPSRAIGIDRVKKILPFARNAAVGAANFAEDNPSDPAMREGLHTHFGKMRDILEKAAERGHLTRQERVDYDREHTQVSRKMKKLNLDGYKAEYLQLAERGTGAQPELPAAPAPIKSHAELLKAGPEDLESSTHNLKRADQRLRGQGGFKNMKAKADVAAALRLIKRTGTLEGMTKPERDFWDAAVETAKKHLE